MKENIEVLEEVLDVLEEEKRKFCDLISGNDFRIEEINSYLQQLSRKEDEDFKVFSPRNVENVHREQIEADISEKKKYEEENDKYNKKINALKVLIDKVNVVIGNLQTFAEVEEKQEAETDLKTEVSNNIGDSAENNIQDDEVENDGMYVKKDQILMNISEEKHKSVFERNHIAHQILNCVSFIIPDAERAKIELTALSKKLME